MSSHLIATYLRTVGKSNKVDVSSERKHKEFPLGTNAGVMSNYAKELSAADNETNWMLWSSEKNAIVSL